MQFSKKLYRATKKENFTQKKHKAPRTYSQIASTNLKQKREGG
jgi:hypothetical protein